LCLLRGGGRIPSPLQVDGEGNNACSGFYFALGFSFGAKASFNPSKRMQSRWRSPILSRELPSFSLFTLPSLMRYDVLTASSKATMPRCCQTPLCNEKKKFSRIERLALEAERTEGQSSQKILKGQGKGGECSSESGKPRQKKTLRCMWAGGTSPNVV